MNEKQKIFIDLFRRNAGNIGVTCTKVNICRDTYYDWFNKPFFNEKDENGNNIQVPNDFRKAAIEIKESVIDFTESAAYKKIAGITTKNIKIKEVFDKDGKIVKLREELIINHPPDTAMIIWVLKTLGKERGWKDTTDINMQSNTGNELSRETEEAIDKLPAEDKKDLIRIGKKLQNV